MLSTLLLHKKKILFLIIILIVYLALVPRILTALKGDYIFGFDQGRDYLVAKSIVVDHKPRLIGSELGGGFAGLGGIYQGPGYYYLLTIPFILFNGDPYGGIVLMLVFSLASIAASYWLGRRVLGTGGGLLVAVLFAISPTFIQQTRYIWNTHPSTVFILLALASLYFYIVRQRWWLLLLTAFLCGFVYNFQTAVAVPMCLGLLVWLVITKERRVRSYGVSLVGFVIAFSPQLLFWVKHKSFALTAVIAGGGSKATSKDSHSLSYYLADHLNSFWYSFLDTFPRPQVWLLILLALVLAYAIWRYLRTEEDVSLRKFYLYLLVLIPSSFLIFSFLRNSVYTYYLMELNVAYIFIFAYVLMKSLHEGLVWLTCALWGILGVFVVYSLYFGTTYFVRELRAPASMESYAYKVKAIDRVYAKAAGKPFGLLIFTPPVYTYEYDYILWWHGQRKYHYVPTSTKESLYFVIVQPDAARPWTYNGWLETVVKPERPLKFDRLENGLLIGALE